MADESAADGAPRRRWDAVSWRFSALLLVALLGIAGTVAYQQFVATRQLRGTVVDDFTGRPVAGASVTSGTDHVLTDARGQFVVARPGTELRVDKTGFDPTAVVVPTDGGRLEVRLRPNAVVGTIRNRVTGQPVPGATVAVKGVAAPGARTDAQGRYFLAGVPLDAAFTVTAAGFAPVEVVLGRREQLDIDLRPDVLEGRITDDQGRPIPGALVAVGTATATTGADGTYQLDGVPEVGRVTVKAPGFHAGTAMFDAGMRADATLRAFAVRAIYADPATLGQPGALNGLLDMMSHTELNALVVDVKDNTGAVYYDTGVPLARAIGAVKPAYDARQLVATLHQRGIYAIARISAFDDPILAERRPEWAVHAVGGGLWRTWEGTAWVNGYRHEVWDYDTALATEAAQLGFDEVELSDVRFPAVGPADQVDYGVPSDAVTRAAAVHGFLSEVHAALAPTQTYLSADVDGSSLWELGDGGVGQQLEDIAGAVDYLCPVLYPSQFAAGTLGFAVPGDHPYEVVLWSLQAGATRIPADARRLRPWLQDFSLGPGAAYGDDQVGREIKAAADFGASGWMLWNGASVYHSKALQPG